LTPVGGSGRHLRVPVVPGLPLTQQWGIAVAKKRLTRKQIKQPDEFLSFSYHAWEWIEAHLSRILAMVGAAVVLVAVAWTWSYFAQEAAKVHTLALTRAIDIYNQPVVELEAGEASVSDDGIPRFKTRRAKLQAAEKAFAAVAGEGDGVGTVAMLLRAGTLLDQGEYGAAVKAYDTFIKKNDDPRFEVLALEGLGYAHEAAKSYDQAIKAFRRIPPEDGQKVSYRAMYHEARILGKQGKKKEAVALFRKVMEGVGAGALADDAARQLALVEGK